MKKNMQKNSHKKIKKKKVDWIIWWKIYKKNSLAIKLIDWVELIIIYTYMRRNNIIKKIIFSNNWLRKFTFTLIHKSASVVELTRIKKKLNKMN